MGGIGSRECGSVVCGSCAPKINWVKDGIQDYIRVCSRCINSSQAKTDAGSRTSKSSKKTVVIKTTEKERGSARKTMGNRSTVSLTQDEASITDQALDSVDPDAQLDRDSKETNPTDEEEVQEEEEEGIILQVGEVLLKKGAFREVKDDIEIQFMLTLTQTGLYKYDITNKQAVWKRQIEDVHSVEPHYDDARVFKLFYYQSGSLTNKSRNAMMHLNMKSGKDSTISLQERNYECVSVFDRNEWILVFRRVLVDYWQREFECRTLTHHGIALIPSPEIYQHHLFLTKKNRIGRLQTRALVFSNEWMYNVKFRRNPTQFKAMKWAISLRALSSLTVYEKSPLVLSMRISHTKNHELIDNLHTGMKRMGEKDKFKFILKDQQERDVLIATFKDLFKCCNHDELHVIIDKNKEIKVHRAQETV